MGIQKPQVMMNLKEDERKIHKKETFEHLTNLKYVYIDYVYLKYLKFNNNNLEVRVYISIYEYILK